MTKLCLMPQKYNTDKLNLSGCLSGIFVIFSIISDLYHAGQICPDKFNLSVFFFFERGEALQLAFLPRIRQKCDLSFCYLHLPTWFASGYLIPYSADGKRMVKVGINYDSQSERLVNGR